jgi:ubiquinone/menaquinone biosynthesis C-methylase UbiE
VDISEDMLKVCIDTFGDDPHFRFSLGRIEELQFSDSYFDVVLCLGAFEYVLEDRVAMSEIARVLKPNGTLIITMHNGTSPYRIWQRRFYWKLKNGISKLKRLAVETRNEGGGKGSEKASFKIHSKTSLQRLLSSCGLETEDIMYYDFNIFLKPLDSLFPRTSVFISKKLEFLCRSRLRFIGTGFILKSRKFR